MTNYRLLNQKIGVIADNLGNITHGCKQNIFLIGVLI